MATKESQYRSVFQNLERLREQVDSVCTVVYITSKERTDCCLRCSSQDKSGKLSILAINQLQTDRPPPPNTLVFKKLIDSLNCSHNNRVQTTQSVG